MLSRVARVYVAALGVVLLLGALVSSAGAQEAPAAEPPPTPPEQLVEQASAERLAKLYVYVHKKYPDLAKPTVDLINNKHPKLWAAVTTRLDEVARKQSPGLPTEIQRQALAILQRVWPNLHREVMNLIDNRYPLLQVEIREITRNAKDEDPRPLIAELLREKYPTLVADVRDEIVVKYPNVLAQVLNVIAVKWPVVFGEVVKQVHKEFPKLAGDIFAMALAKHPELIDAAGKILRGEPLEEEKAEEKPEHTATPAAPADGPKGEEKAPPPE